MLVASVCFIFVKINKSDDSTMESTVAAGKRGRKIIDKMKERISANPRSFVGFSDNDTRVFIDSICDDAFRSCDWQIYSGHKEFHGGLLVLKADLKSSYSLYFEWSGMYHCAFPDQTEISLGAEVCSLGLVFNSEDVFHQWCSIFEEFGSFITTTIENGKTVSFRTTNVEGTIQYAGSSRRIPIRVIIEDKNSNEFVTFNIRTNSKGQITEIALAGGWHDPERNGVK